MMCFYHPNRSDKQRIFKKNIRLSIKLVAQYLNLLLLFADVNQIFYNFIYKNYHFIILKAGKEKADEVAPEVYMISD